MASADGEQQLPIEFELSQNYPNSFNRSTTIRYGLPEPSNIRIEIYNILGQRVATLFDGIKQPCYHNATWNAASTTPASISPAWKRQAFQRPSRWFCVICRTSQDISEYQFLCISAKSPLAEMIYPRKSVRLWRQGCTYLDSP